MEIVRLGDSLDRCRLAYSLWQDLDTPSADVSVERISTSEKSYMAFMIWAVNIHTIPARWKTNMERKHVRQGGGEGVDLAIVSSLEKNCLIGLI